MLTLEEGGLQADALIAIGQRQAKLSQLRVCCSTVAVRDRGGEEGV